MYQYYVITRRESSRRLLLISYTLYLNLHLGQAMLPDDDIWRDTVLAVIEENNPEYRQFKPIVSSLPS